jgi:Protein of unknown function (DUF2490)
MTAEFPNEARRTVTVASIATSVEMTMWRFAKLARSLAVSALAAWVISVAAPCAAQEEGGVDAPTSPNTGDGPDTGNARGSLFAPSSWLVLSTPVQKQVALKLYGFYIGRLDVPVLQLDLPIRTTRFLTITPSYMRYSVPASGLDQLPSRPGSFTDSYAEQQFRIDGTVGFAVRKLEMSVRNMYVRRFRPAPATHMNRYRGRIAIAYPLPIQGRIVKPFASYEAFHERVSGWNRRRLWSGVTLPVNKRVFVQPSYLWESSDGSRDIHYLLFGLIVNTR